MSETKAGRFYAKSKEDREKLFININKDNISVSKSDKFDFICKYFLAHTEIPKIISKKIIPYDLITIPDNYPILKKGIENETKTQTYKYLYKLHNNVIESLKAIDGISPMYKKADDFFKKYLKYNEANSNSKANSNLYFHKYKKYKNKYLALKNLI
jgi:hypothetical protein